MKFLTLLFIAILTPLSLCDCKRCIQGEGVSPSKTSYATDKGVEGIIVEEGDDDFYILKTSEQYIVFEADMQNSFEKQDTLYGDFTVYDECYAYNSKNNQTIRIWILCYFDDYKESINYLKSKKYSSRKTYGL